MQNQMDIRSFDTVQQLLEKALSYNQMFDWVTENTTIIKNGIAHEIEVHNIMTRLRKKIEQLVHYIRVYFMAHTKIIETKLQNVLTLTKKYEVIKEHFESKGLYESHSVLRAKMEAVNARNVLYSLSCKI